MSAHGTLHSPITRHERNHPASETQTLALLLDRSQVTSTLHAKPDTHISSTRQVPSTLHAHTVARAPSVLHGAPPTHTHPTLHASRPHPPALRASLPFPQVQRARAARAWQRPTPHVSPRGESGLGAAARAWLGHACAPKKIKEAMHAPHPSAEKVFPPEVGPSERSCPPAPVEHALPCETTKDTEPVAQTPPSERGIDSSVASRA